MSRVAYVAPALLLAYAVFLSIDVVAQAYLRDPHYYWLGARILAQGGDPYDAIIWDAAVRASFAEHGAALRPPWPDAFKWPLWTAVVLLPMAALPLRAATAMWQILLIAGSIAGTLLALHAAGAPRRTRALFLTLVLASEPFVLTVLVGQFGGLMLFAAASYAVLASSARQIAAGLSLALLALKPHIVVALVPAALADLAARRRRVAVAAAAVAVASVVAVSLVMRPTWPVAWLAKLTVAASTQNGANLGGALIALGFEGAWAIATLAVIVVGGAVLWSSPRAPIDFVAVGACVSLLATPYAGSHDHMLLVLAWARVLAAGARAEATSATVLLGGLVIAATLLPWVLYAYALQARPNEALNGLVPLATLLVLAYAYAVGTGRTRSASGLNMP